MDRSPCTEKMQEQIRKDAVSEIYKHRRIGRRQSNGFLIKASASEMTYIVSSGALNSTH